jgi:hypothetical protein
MQPNCFGISMSEKLGINPGEKVIFFNCPDEVYHVLSFPPKVMLLPHETPEMVNAIYIFERSRDGLQQILNYAMPKVLGNGSIWVAYPKKASRVKTDLDVYTVMQTGIDAGLIDVKVCSLDDTWTGVKFVFPSVRH